MKPTTSSRLLAGAILATLAVPSLAQQSVSVRLNGQPLALSATPLQLNGRTLLPLRDVFESLGASVNWNPVAQSIAAQSGTTQIQLGINNPIAFVNGRNVSLDQPAILVGGRAFVPLRFVAEATGARVNYNSQLSLVSIQNLPFSPVGGATQVADYTDDARSSISVPADAVVAVQLDRALNSNTSRVGETFTASVVSRQMGDSEFPAGSKLEGLVTEARPSDKRNPGVLDFRFQTAILPDGTRLPLRGDLASLDQNGVSQQGGRLVANANGARKNDSLKVIGIGAGAGFVLGRILKTDSTVSTVLGAAGGFLFGRSRDKRAQEARLAQNTTLGVRLRDGVRFRDTNYGRAREAFLGGNTRAFDPRDYGYDSRIDGSAQGRYDGYQVSNSLPVPADVYGNDPRSGNIYDDGAQATYPEDVLRQNGNTGVQDNGFGRDTANRDFNRNDGFGGNNGFPIDNGRSDGIGGDTYGNALAQSISIPDGAVIPVRLDAALSSATSRVGDPISASIDSQQMGDSEFPSGTRILGEVVEARPRTKSQPGVLDLNFQTALLPSGERVPLRGQLISLDEGGVQPVGGRLVARQARSDNANRTKIIGIGAAAGFAIGRIIGKNGVLPPVLGALGGYLYGQKNGSKTRTAEAVVARDARLSIRLDNGLSYNGGTYYASRAQYLRAR